MALMHNNLIRTNRAEWLVVSSRLVSEDSDWEQLQGANQGDLHPMESSHSSKFQGSPGAIVRAGAHRQKFLQTMQPLDKIG